MKLLLKVKKLAQNPSVQRCIAIYLVFIACMIQFPVFVLHINLFTSYNVLQHQRILEVGNLKPFELTDKDIELMVQDETYLPKNNNSKIQACPFPPKHMVGREKQIHKVEKSFNLEGNITDLLIGGRYVPPDCVPYARIAIIIPYRDREEHLKTLLYNLIPKLKRQKLDFTFYLIEQTHTSSFNRGMIRNIGFVEASKIADYDCYIFNDVDTILEDDRNLYLCNKQAVRHLITGVDRFSYELIYEFLIGGAIGFTKEQFTALNGYSNQFFIWGGEDDNLYVRIKCSNWKLERPINKIGMFTTLSHDHDPVVKERFKVYAKAFHQSRDDGLNSLKYKRLKLENRKLYTWIYVDIDEKSVKQDMAGS